MAYAKPPKAAQFKPGQSGNPNGRPRKIPAIDKLLQDIAEDDYTEVIKALFKKAKKGDVRAAEVLFDRAYGKARQTVEIDQVYQPQVMIIGGQKLEF
jgi:hypothetical protein